MTARGNYGVIQKYGQYKLKERKNMVNISEAIITEDDCTPKINLLFPTVKDKIQIENKANAKPMIPAINETVQLDKQHNEISTEINKTKSNGLPEKQNFDTKGNISKTKMFINKQKRERAEKNKLDSLKTKNMAEDRKKKLEQLYITTKRLIHIYAKKKTIPKPPVHVHEECTIDMSLPIKTREIEIDQTWSPPPTKVPYDKKRQKIQTNLVKNTTFRTAKTSHGLSKNPQILLDKNFQSRTVAKPETIFSKLKLHNDYGLVDNGTYDLLTPKIDDVDDCLVPKDHNTKLEENIGSKIEEEKNCIFSNRKMLKINFSAEFANTTKVDSETQTDLQFQNESTYNKEMLNCIETIKESFFNVLFSNKMCSESTQTDNYTNPLPSWVSSKESSSQQNSVLNCTNNLLQTEKTNLELCEATNLNINGFLNTFHVDKIDNVNNVKSTVPNALNVEDSNKIMHVPCLNDNVMENYLNTYKSSLTNETNNSLFENENNFCKEKTHLVNNDELFTKLNEVTNEDITQFMKKLNCDLHFLTKNNCVTNDLHVTCKHLELNKNNIINEPSSCFSEFHDEFQAELDMLDQLNNSLCDIEKMDSDATTKRSNKRSINVVHNDRCSLNNMKTTLNSFYSNDVPTSCSKLNSLSSNMMSVDKTIIDFSIQMFEQLIKDEELRVKQHLTMNHLREKSLINRLKWEVAMCDLQITNFKNRPGHEKEFQLFKQQHRGRIKKLENSLSQVKRLGRVIDSVYKQRIVMLEEHLLYLKMQSSSKKVIRKLKNLDKIPKIEECANQSLNTHCFDQCNRIDTIDIKESEHVKTNSSELEASLQNNTLPMISSIDKSKIILRNQATSPIDIETKNIELIEHVKGQTDIKHSTINKSIQTSEKFFKCSNNDNENTKLSDAIITNKRSMSPISPTSPVKIVRRPSDSSISTNSEQGDMNIQIKNLQKQLEARKLESSKLKKKQKKLKLENLKIKEQELLKQIELYDKQIEELKKSLLVEIEQKSIQVMKNYSIKHNSSSKNSTTSTTDVQNICYENNYNKSEQNNQNSHVSNKIVHNKNKEKYVCPVTTNNSINCNVPQDKLIGELQQNVIVELKENFKKYKNINSEEIDICKFANDSFQSSETNQVCEILLLHQDPTVIKHDTLKHFNNSRTEINIVSLNVQPAGTLTHASNNNENRSVSNLETNKVVILNLKHLQDVPDTYNDQEKNSIIKSLITCKNINYNNSDSSLSSSSHLQKIPVIDSTKNINDICVKKDNNIIQWETSNNETKIESMNDYSPDFTSDENSSEFQENTNSVINVHDNDKNSESSYEEDRSEEEIMFENETFIKSYLNDNNTIQDEEKPASDKIDCITNNILNRLIKDIKQIFKTNSIKPLSLIKSNELNNLTEETPLLLILKREEEHRKMVLLAEQASSISNVLFKRHLQPYLFKSFQIYLPKLNEIEVKKLKLYLNWSSNRKKLKLSEYLKCQHKNSNADNDESFEMFYQNYQEQKKSLMFQDDGSTTVLTQTQQEAEKLKAEQMRIEEEIERLCKSDESQFFLREIPNKPPPPYKSPTKTKAPADIPCSSDTVKQIVQTAVNELFNNPQNVMTNEFFSDSDSCLHIDYNTLIFDYCKEISQDMFVDDEDIPLWKKTINNLKRFYPKPKNPNDLSNIIMKKLNQIIDIDEYEEKVNKFLIKQIHKEDSKWTDLKMDQMNIRNNIVQNLINKLICDTATNIKSSFYLKFM